MLFSGDFEVGNEERMGIISKQSIWHFRKETYTENTDISPIVRLWRLF